MIVVPVLPKPIPPPIMYNLEGLSEEEINFISYVMRYYGGIVDLATRARRK